jgi:membrane protease YdiL (CAAX protease family)
MNTIVPAVFFGMLVMLAGTLPRNLLFAANLRYGAGMPWAVPVVAVYLFCFWKYLQGAGPPPENAAWRRDSLRAFRVAGRTWFWSLVAGALAIVALVLALRLANRFFALPVQTLPDLSHVPASTVAALLVAAAPVAGIVEEAAFRGYMQGPIESAYGLPVAILVTGTMFPVAHLDFAFALWPYYVAVAAIYGTVTHYAGSILPAVVLHTAGNLYSNLDLWLHGRAEWQTAGAATGDALVAQSLALVAATLAALWAFVRLARAAAPRRTGRAAPNPPSS